MHPVIYRSASACGAVACLVGAVGACLFDARDARADDAKSLTTAMKCERATEPGRVKCSIEAHVSGGRSIAWADVALVELPDFTAALKGRIGPSDATSREAASQRWAFGLVARKTGEGEARARVRALVCEPKAGAASAPKCQPVVVDVKALVHVG